MHHRRFGFGRVFIFLLLIGGLMAYAGGRYRSGFEDGFMRGMAFAAVDAGSGAASPDSAAIPPAYSAPWGRGGLGPVKGGSIGFGLMGLAFVAFTALLVMGAIGRHRWGRHSWGHHGPPGAWGHHGHRGYHGHGHRGHGHHTSSDEVGPEKQPEDIA